MKTTMAVLSGVVIGVLVVILGVRFKLFSFRLLEPPLTASMCEATVKLSLVSDGTPTGKKIVADPPHPVCLAVGQPMNWVIVDKGTVKIVFDPFNGTEGPFPADPNLLNNDGTMINKNRGTYEAKNSNTIVGSLNVKTPGAEDYQRAWKYKVNWVPLDGSTVNELDPVICIRR
jgi:hypothetical protein